MEIHGMRSYSYIQNGYHTGEIPKVDQVDSVKNVKEQNNYQELTPKVEEGTAEENRLGRLPNQFRPIKELSQEFQSGKDYSLIGRDRNIENLDIQKTISEMKQDTILKDYTYFVGNGKNIYQSEDGVVRRK